MMTTVAQDLTQESIEIGNKDIELLSFHFSRKTVKR